MINRFDDRSYLRNNQTIKYQCIVLLIRKVNDFFNLFSFFSDISKKSILIAICCITHMTCVKKSQVIFKRLINHIATFSYDLFKTIFQVRFFVWLKSNNEISEIF